MKTIFAFTCAILVTGCVGVELDLPERELNLHFTDRLRLDVDDGELAWECDIPNGQIWCQKWEAKSDEELLDELLLEASEKIADYDLPLPPVYWSNDPALQGAPMPVYGYTRSRAFADGRMSSYIVINICLADPRTPKGFLKTTILHELAHYVDFHMDGASDGHKGFWAKVMRRWGKAPHQYGRPIKHCVKAYKNEIEEQKNAIN